MNTNLPKTIWFMWLQGIDDAPFVVKKCYESWISQNPGWEMIFLDDKNLQQYINIPKPENATNQAWSDIIRINLLAEHGGVWVDATCFCMKPLDAWLPELMPNGFFAFERPGPDRMLSSWFIASEKENHISIAYQKAVNDYWQNNPGIKSFDDAGPKLLKKRLNRMNPQQWFNWPVRRVLKLYPYFWFHYLFEYVYLRDEKFRVIWDSCPKISSDIPHKLQFAGLFKPLTDEIKREIDSKKSPVYKLTWKFEAEDYKEGCVMNYLLER